MNDAQPQTRRFRLSIRAALAGFLLFGGIEALITGAREPIGTGAVILVNWIIDKIKNDSVKLREPTVSWVEFWAELAFGVIFLLLAISIGAKARSSATSAAGSRDRS